MRLLDLIFPKKCLGCGRVGKYVCAECEVGMWEEEQICPTCCRNSRYGLRHRYCRGDMEGLTCFWAYEGMARKLITRAKYKGQFDVLETLISNIEMLNNSQFYNWQKFLETKPVVVPVPLHPKRERERGFNQAEVVAKSLAVRHSLAYDSHALLRVKDTHQQVGRSKSERLKNIEDAFAVNDKWQMKNDEILLVDDVWTTGATMRECAKTLKKAGAKRMWGLVLAR